MMVNAMEASGVEGTYKSVCESVMRTLRGNSVSIMTMLEAFVYDPLVNWRGLTSMPKPIHDNATSHVLEPDAHVHSNFDFVRRLGSYNTAVVTQENLNVQAVAVLSRVNEKLSGSDRMAYRVGGLNPQAALKTPLMNVRQQVAKLIDEAENRENLSQSYLGWCPFW
jgi:FKBP12-rapamycin complex-associated protein